MEKIFVDRERLNDMVYDKDKTEVLLRSLPKSFRVVALMDDANNMDFHSVCALPKPKMERRNAHNNSSSSVTPAAQKAFVRIGSTNNGKRQIQYRYCGKLGYSKPECRNRRRDQQPRRMRGIMKNQFNSTGKPGQFF